MELDQSPNNSASDQDPTSLTLGLYLFYQIKLKGMQITIKISEMHNAGYNHQMFAHSFPVKFTALYDILWKTET